MRRLLTCSAAIFISCGPPPVTADMCPDFPGVGKCDSTTAEWCDATSDMGPPATLNCGALGGTCGMNDALGAWCAVPMGTKCTIDGQDRSKYLYCGDASGPTSGLACDLDQGCVTSSATCTPGGQVPTCSGNDLVVDCTAWGQPVQRDCMALGGTACMNGACVGVGADAGCDATVQCGNGLACDSTGHCAFTIATHPEMPQVVKFSGPVLMMPKVQTISWASDPQGAVLDGLVQELTTTSFWSITTSEYGVGPLVVQPPQHLPDPLPTTYSDTQFINLIKANTTGASPAWGAVDTNTIYMIAIPSGVPFDDGTGSKCCTDYDGYHNEATIGTTHVPYAVVCTCPGFDGPQETNAQQLTVVASHELVESATDPYFQSRPAYAQSDDDHAVWTVLTQGELADMCELNSDASFIPPDGTFMVQRTWSNAAAKAGKNPCVPGGEPFAGAQPVLTTSGVIQYGGAWTTKVVKIPVGMTGEVDVQLYTDVPMGPFTVQAFDYNSYYNGGSKLLKLSLDNQIGNNGDTLHLSITPMAFDSSLKAAVFVIETHFNNNKSQSLAFGVVTAN
jgi:hypothetical protein